MTSPTSTSSRNGSNAGRNGRERTLLLLAIYSKISQLAGPPPRKLTVGQLLGRESS